MKHYTYFRSSAAFRVRIALNLKGVATEQIFIHLTKDGGKQHAPEYRAVNPQRRVPSLVPGMVITVSEVVTAPVERFTAAGRQPGRTAGLAIAWLRPAGDERHG